MPEQHSVYDLGEIDPAPRPAAKRGADRGSMDRFRPPYRPVPTPRVPQRVVAGSFSLLLPGAGQCVSGRCAAGFFFLAGTGLVASLAWAVLATLDRLPDTLALLGFPREAAVWVLAMLYPMAGALHVWSVLGTLREVQPSRCPSRAPHPVVAAVASAAIPGWGQILNGCRRRAAFFLAGVWLAAGAWVLASPAATRVLDTLNLYLPVAVRTLCAAPARWTLPAVLWTLAVYDAAITAAARRR